MTVSVQTTVTVTIDGTEHKLTQAEARTLLAQLKAAVEPPAHSPLLDRVWTKYEPRYGDPMLAVGQNVAELPAARPARTEIVYGARP
jgi:hypothetical protein